MRYFGHTKRHPTFYKNHTSGQKSKESKQEVVIQVERYNQMDE